MQTPQSVLSNVIICVIDNQVQFPHRDGEYADYVMLISNPAAECERRLLQFNLK